MKTMKLLLLLIVFLVNNTCAQHISEMIEGTWKYTENRDCPDVLVFSSNGIYQVLNDCGSQNPGVPVIEKGNWSYIAREDAIKLENREFVSPNSVFSEYHGKNKELVFFIKKISENELTLCFNISNRKCINERYTRIKK